MHEIRAVLQDYPAANEVVLTIDMNQVVNLAGRPAPYLSVSSTEPDKLDDLLARLKPIGQGIEVRPLIIWIPSIRT